MPTTACKGKGGNSGFCFKYLIDLRIPICAIYCSPKKEQCKRKAETIGKPSMGAATLRLVT